MELLRVRDTDEGISFIIKTLVPSGAKSIKSGHTKPLYK